METKAPTYHIAPRHFNEVVSRRGRAPSCGVATAVDNHRPCPMRANADSEAIHRTGVEQPAILIPSPLIIESCAVQCIMRHDL